jgi:uncharacterized tellurite resistance protein B-like protein
MFEALKNLIAGTRSESPSPGPASAGDGNRGLQVAACALLLEIAHADNDFTEDERQHIEEVVVRHFDLTPAEARSVMEVAEEARRESVDLHQFTALVARHYDEGQRLVLAELLWRIVYADGKLSEREGILARKLGYLLDLPPGYLAEARKKATGSA